MRNLFLLCSFISCSLQSSLPGKIVGYDDATKIPKISLSSLELGDYKILKKFNITDLPDGCGWGKRVDYYKNRNRKVYLSDDQKFVLKVWQKKYPSRVNFLSALHAGFYEKIAQIAGLIYDEQGECRGYICPYMIDRTFNRSAWKSYGVVLEKNHINVSIYSSYEKQPQLYTDFFDKVLEQSKNTHYLTLDFCPSNIAINPIDGQMYLIDLEDVQPTTMFDDSLISSIFHQYCPNDYLEQLRKLLQV